MTATEPTKPVNKPRTKGIDWKAIESMYLQGLLPEAISEKTGVSNRTISVHISRHGLNKRRQEITKACPNGDVNTFSRSSKLKLAAEVERTIDKVTSRDPKSAESLNLHADTLQKVVKSAAVLHGWGEGVNLAIVLPGVLSGTSDTEQSIEVETVPELSTDGQQADSSSEPEQ